MSKTIICYVRCKDGKHKQYKSKAGANFKGPDGKSYSAPNADNFEVLEKDGALGTKRMAFYVQGQPKAIPLSKEGKWSETTNHDQDVDMLVHVTRQALMEANMADAKANMTLMGQGIIIALLVLNWLW